MSALRAGVWHQECPECHARRLSPNVDPQSLSCDECGYTTVAPNVSVSAPAEDRTPGDICGDVRLFADEYLYDDPAWSLPMLGGTNADNPMRAVWRGGHLDRRNREQRLVDFAREKVAETVHHFRSGELKGFDCAPQTLGLDKLCDAVVLATVRALAPASAAMPPVSAPAEDRTPSDAMCTICGNPRHYPALAEQCVGWHSIGLADVVDWPLEGEDAPAEDRTPDEPGTRRRGMMRFEYKGFSATATWSESAHAFYGEVGGIRDVVTFEGATMEDAEREFHESVDDYIEFSAARTQPEGSND